MLLKEFLNSLVCIEEDVVQWSFEMNDLVNKISRDIYILSEDKYIEFIKKLSKLEVKNKVFLKLVNAEKDKKKEDS